MDSLKSFSFSTAYSYITPLDLSPVQTFYAKNVTLQNTWIVSHVLTLFGTSLYIYSLISENSPVQHQAYKISTLGSFFTYLIVLIRTHIEERIEFSETKSAVVIKKKAFTISDLLKNENAQLLGYIILWNFTEKSILKLTPFYIYSSLNISSFFVLEIFPHSPLCVALVPLLSYMEAPLLILASHLDLGVFGILLRESISSKAAYPVIAYFFLFALRFENSRTSRSAVCFILRFIDDQIQQDPVPQSVRTNWSKFRKSIEFVIPYEYGKSSNLEVDCESEFTDSTTTPTN